MFSFSHLAIIFLIALLVFGPEKLPEIARQIGKVMGDFRKASTDFRRVIEQEFAEIERQQREKEEAARRKALEASNPASAPAAPADAGQTGAALPRPGEQAASGQGSSAPTVEGYNQEGAASGAPTAEENAGAPPGTVANTSARDSGYESRENPATPADVHPA